MKKTRNIFGYCFRKSRNRHVLVQILKELCSGDCGYRRYKELKWIHFCIAKTRMTWSRSFVTFWNAWISKSFGNRLRRLCFLRLSCVNSFFFVLCFSRLYWTNLDSSSCSQGLRFLLFGWPRVRRVHSTSSIWQARYPSKASIASAALCFQCFVSIFL